MTVDPTDTTERQAANVAGYGYLTVFLLALFANFMVRERLVQPDDAATTVRNIVESAGLFRAGLVSFLAVFVLDVAIAWALYVLFRRVGKHLALLTAWFRLVYTTFLGVALIFFFLILELGSGADHFAALEAGQIEAQVMLYLEAFDAAWLIGLACFGVHLVLLGSISLKSKTVPRALSVLLIAAGGAYVIDTVAHALLPRYDDYASVFLAIVAIPSVIAEFGFALWLLMRPGRGRQVPTRLRAHASVGSSP